MTAVEELRTECDELYDYVSSIPQADWSIPTDFWAWSTKDEILHLYIVDQFALTSLEGEAPFDRVRRQRQADNAAGIELSQKVRAQFQSLSKAQVLAMWREQYGYLCDELGSRPPRARTPWFGPDMSILSMISARQMEVWAHGQDIYDLFGPPRTNNSRLRNICELGVRTFGWTFHNRGVSPPGMAPMVVLTGPTGAEWRWNDGQPGLVQGPAEDFAMVVTQRRNIADTSLRCEGESASSWMSLAQCFAGPPADPPAPGVRGRRKPPSPKEP